MDAPQYDSETVNMMVRDFVHLPLTSMDTFNVFGKQLVDYLLHVQRILLLNINTSRWWMSSSLESHSYWWKTDEHVTVQSTIHFL